MIFRNWDSFIGDLAGIINIEVFFRCEVSLRVSFNLQSARRFNNFSRPVIQSLYFFGQTEMSASWRTSKKSQKRTI